MCPLRCVFSYLSGVLYEHFRTRVRVNLQVVSDPLRASLASFAYTANTASWYSVRDLRCCKTTEVSLPTTTAWGGGGQVAGRKIDGSAEMKKEPVGGKITTAKMEIKAINVGKWKCKAKKGRMMNDPKKGKERRNNNWFIEYKAQAQTSKDNDFVTSEIKGWHLVLVNSAIQRI